MEQFLRGLLCDLVRHCDVLKGRITAIPDQLDLRSHLLAAYQVVEAVRRDAVQLLADPSFGSATLLRNHLQLYKRAQERALFAESFALPFLERYGQRDYRLTRLCRRLLDQVRWPLAPPLVAAFSSQYYWTKPEFNIICVPAAEEASLLGLPDLVHELGHILQLHCGVALLGTFLQELLGYVGQEQQRVAAQQRPPEYLALYNHLLGQWAGNWLLEFVPDMVATYLVGPAFGWQHLRLCSGHSQQDAYHPSLGESGTHPADEARLRGILAVLGQVGAADSGVRIKELWERYLAVSGQTKPADYDLCYPDTLIASLARHVVAGCRALGLRGIDQAPSNPPPAVDIPLLLCEAWERFLADPRAYLEWGPKRIEALWQELGAAPAAGAA